MIVVSANPEIRQRTLLCACRTQLVPRVPGNMRPCHLGRTVDKITGIVLGFSCIINLAGLPECIQSIGPDHRICELIAGQLVIYSVVGVPHRGDIRCVVRIKNDVMFERRAGICLAASAFFPCFPFDTVGNQLCHPEIRRRLFRRKRYVWSAYRYKKFPVVVCITECRNMDLLQIVGAVCRPCYFPCTLKRRQQHCRQNRDDRNYDEQFY